MKLSTKGHVASRRVGSCLLRWIAMGAFALGVGGGGWAYAGGVTTGTMTIGTIASLPANGNGLKMPMGPLVQGLDGKLYGTGMAGGHGSNGGGVFSVTTDGTYTDLYDFNAASGASEPWGGLILGHDGNLYGGLLASPASNLGGALYSISSSGQFTSLYAFDTAYFSSAVPTNTDGIGPNANLVQGPDGTFYGTAFKGGSYGGGTIYSLSPSGTFTVLYDFPAQGSADMATGGAWPSGTLAFGPDGNLYGMTMYGGANGSGILYRITPAGAFTVLLSFPSIPNGAVCQGIEQNDEALTLGPDGDFYGTRCNDVNGSGSIFKFDPNTLTLTTLHAFAPQNPDPYLYSNADGASPSGSLVLGADGNFYGTTSWGGLEGLGTVFLISPSGVFETLYSFGNSGDATWPNPLIVGSDNNFYGTSMTGGINNTGAIFRLKHFPQGDIVINNPSTGTLDVRLMGRLGQQQLLQNVAAGYYPVAVADFDGDGIPDILWTSANHDLYLWLGGKGSRTGFVSKYVGSYPPGWTVVGAADIDGDGKADLYWINTNKHEFGYWLMNGATATTLFSTSYTEGYYPIAIGDFNGDGKADVLWSSSKNDLYFWFSTVSSSNSGKFLSAAGGTYPAGWKVAGVGDLNGDGISDIVWMSTDGTQWGYWLINGVVRLAAHTFELSSDSKGYNIVSVGDYNGDGLADLVWSNGTNLYLWNNIGTCGAGSGNVCAFTSEAGALSPQTNGATVFNNTLP